jgi:hypothetical protein
MYVPSTVSISELMEKTVELPTGQFFSPDELITSAVDGMKYILRDLLSPEGQFGKFTEYEADELVVSKVNLELNHAVLYHCVVQYWNDCVGNGYGLIDHDKGIALVPFDKELEVARTVSTYRRLIAIS